MQNSALGRVSTGNRAFLIVAFKRGLCKDSPTFVSLHKKEGTGSRAHLWAGPSGTGRKSWDGRAGELTEGLAHPCPVAPQTTPTMMLAYVCISVTANWTALPPASQRKSFPHHPGNQGSEPSLLPTGFPFYPGYQVWCVQ